LGGPAQVPVHYQLISVKYPLTCSVFYPLHMTVLFLLDRHYPFPGMILEYYKERRFLSVV
jgi:hypothetical protein